MPDCIFCKIAKKEIDAHTIYDDDIVTAFLDIHPINPGHLLVIPKKHEPDFHTLDAHTYTHLMDVVKQLAGVVDQTMRPKKVGLIVAGFDIPHTHIHIVPMHGYHDITSKSMLEGKRANPSDAELAAVAKTLTNSL